MKLSELKYIFKLTAILFLVTAAVALMLGGVNALTADRIAAITAEKTAAAIRNVIDSEAAPETLEAFPDETGNVTAVHKMGDDGWAIEVVVGGSQGNIHMMVGVLSDGTVSGISFIKMSETPGLGDVANKATAKGEAFRSQFIGVSGSVAVTKDGGTIDALSGATITSRAVANGVNAALACAAKLS